MRCRIKDADESLPFGAFCIMTDKSQADSAAATDQLRHGLAARNPSVRHRLEDVRLNAHQISKEQQRRQHPRNASCLLPRIKQQKRLETTIPLMETTSCWEGPQWRAPLYSPLSAFKRLFCDLHINEHSSVCSRYHFSRGHGSLSHAVISMAVVVTVTLCREQVDTNYDIC